MRNHLAVCAQQCQAPVKRAYSPFAFLLWFFFYWLLGAGIAVMPTQASALANANAQSAQASVDDAQAREKPVPPKPKTERYDIEVEFQPEKGFLRATATVTLRAVESTSVVVMELSRYLQIQEVTDAKGRKLGATRGGRIGSHTAVVTLAEPVPANEQFALKFRYEGVLARSPLDYITKDGILLRDESRWYPAIDHAGFAHHDITVTLPDRWSSFLGGWLDDRMEGKIQRWVTDPPVSSRALVAKPWPSEEDSQAMIPFGEKGIPVLDFYRALLDSYEQRMLVSIVGFPGQEGVMGYSGPAFQVVSRDVIRFARHTQFVPEFCAHETAHQWFPIEVTLASQEDGWLAESLAEYLAWRYLREKQPDDARTMVARAMRNALEDQPMRPLSRGLKLFAEEDNDFVHRALYQRGMLVWRTLETVIDSERVDRALREYYRRHRGGPASIADFRKICEEISGRDLRWFFDYYIIGTQLPEITVRRISSNAPNETAGEIVVRNAPPEFQVRVEMRMHTASGSFDHSVATSGEVTRFTMTSPEPVTRITLDPDARILRVTEIARRHQLQTALMAKLGEYERAGKSEELAFALAKAAFNDPEDLSHNRQRIDFFSARLQFLRKNYREAWRGFENVIYGNSLEPMQSDFYVAWARVYRAKIATAQGRAAQARAEARAGLEMNSPALETPVRWPEASKEMTARAELEKLAATRPARATPQK